MRKAIVFLENLSIITLIKMAMRSHEKGYDNFLISRPLKPHEHQMLLEYKQQHGRPLFVRIVETERWKMEDLEVWVDEFAQLRELIGITTIGGGFHPDGLVGAMVAELARKRGLPNQNADGVYKCNNKYLTRDALKAARVPTVDFGLATDEQSLLQHARRIGYPVILKPINGVASQLIIKCRNDQELLDGFKLALERLPKSPYRFLYEAKHTYPDSSGNVITFDPLHTLLIEGYISGREASVELVISEDNIIPLLVHDKILVTEEERVVYEHLLTVPPVRFSEKEIEELKSYAIDVARAMEVKNCICHVELRYDDQHGPQLLEINPRTGGMMVSQSLMTMINFDPLDAMLNLATGTFTPKNYESISKLHAMFSLYPPHSGYLERVDGIEEVQKLPGMLISRLTYPVGSWIDGDDEEIFLFVGWMQGENLEQIVSTYEKVKQTVRFHINRNKKS